MEENKEKEIEIGLDLTKNSSETKVEDNPRLHVDLLQKALEDSEKKYLLLYSDFENYKKRVTKEKEELVSNTKVKMLTSLLDMDNDLTYAIKAIKSEEAKNGLEIISLKLLNFLKSHGIEEIQTDTYDEELHEVISVMEVGESKVIDVVSKGYSLNGKPFRYPKIILGK